LPVEPAKRRAGGDETVTAIIDRFPAPPGEMFAGIDVGENFLDLAIVNAARRTMSFQWVALDPLGEVPCTALARQIKEVAPEFDARATVLVDSPRWPRDLDLAQGTVLRRPVPPQREIDVELKRIFPLLMGAPDGKSYKPGLAMFPTPLHTYFAQWANHPKTKPHLAAMTKELFEKFLEADKGGAAHNGADGGTFTRFMLAGFATYRALERIGVNPFESYPDLQMRLCAPATKLPAKRLSAALTVRSQVVASLCQSLGIVAASAPRTLDQADAAVMALAAALSARRGALWTVSHPCEGRFMLALDDAQSRCLAAPDA
jgi:hypothetical protein